MNTQDGKTTEQKERIYDLEVITDVKGITFLKLQLASPLRIADVAMETSESNLPTLELRFDYLAKLRDLCTSPSEELRSVSRVKISIGS